MPVPVRATWLTRTSHRSKAGTTAGASMHESGLTTVDLDRTRTVRVAAGEHLCIRRRSPNMTAWLWALCEPNACEHLSVQLSRAHLGRTTLRRGDTLVSNARRAVLTWIESSIHDAHTALRAATDGHGERHGNYRPGQCEDRFREAIGCALAGASRAPCPLHLFTGNVDHDLDEGQASSSPIPNSHLLLRAEAELMVVMSVYPSHALHGGASFLSPHTPEAPLERLMHSGEWTSRPSSLCDMA